MKNKARIEGVS